MTGYHPVALAYNVIEPISGVTESIPPIIFLHGITRSKEYWKNIPQVVANETRRKVYTVDARNHGDTEWSDQFSFEYNANDLLNFMNMVHEPKVILIGHSMGGMTAMIAAMKKPERFEKVIVIDVSPRKISKQIMDNAATYVSLLRRVIQQVPQDFDERGIKKIIFDYLLRNSPPGMQPEIKRRSEHDLEFIALKRSTHGNYAYKGNMEVIENALRNPDALMSEPEGVYDGSTCFIYGKLSPFLVGADEHRIKKHFPKAKLVGIEEAAHAVHLDCPLEFTEAVLKFLKETDL